MVARPTGRILLAVDGESHTEAAVCWALDLALGLGMTLNPVHVRDPYLKQFYTEIYAQGREEYLEHVQQCLEEKARLAQEWFETIAHEYLQKRGEKQVPEWSFDVLDGDPVEQVRDHLEKKEFSIIVLGRRRQTRLAVLRSRDLGERLTSLGSSVPVLVVPQPIQD